MRFEESKICSFEVQFNWWQHQVNNKNEIKISGFAPFAMIDFLNDDLVRFINNIIYFNEPLALILLATKTIYHLIFTVWWLTKNIFYLLSSIFYLYY